MTRYLLVTNDFPPRFGGIESFNQWVADELSGEVTVVTRQDPGWEVYDSRLPFPVRRLPGPLLPGRPLRRAVHEAIDDSAPETIIFGAVAPLAALSPELRRGSVRRIVGLTHGHEVTWARSAAPLLSRWFAGLDAVSYISDYTRYFLAPLVGDSKLVRITPPVDMSVFRPAEQPVTDPICIAAARFTRQKGIHVLLRAWPQVLKSIPEARLRLIGAGAYEPTLRKIVGSMPDSSSIEWVGPMPRERVPAELQAARVFALPVQSRWRGLYAEGLGLAAAEAAACGLPVVVGDSGGAPETVVDGGSGSVVSDANQTAAALTQLLASPELSERMGRAGIEHVRARYSSEIQRRGLRVLLEG
ncbi:MAG: alpha-(1-2)-phosphatidylinositol mannosyltransferase [Propionibacterium sp.]|nr:MAG: alpha-(1-2)-phosphatidylinositol mannosyltransferase [Propionibacterium sp.]